MLSLTMRTISLTKSFGTIACANIGLPSCNSDINIIHYQLKIILTVNSKRPKVIRIDQACEVTDRDKHRLKIVTITLKKLSSTFKLKAFRKAGFWKLCVGFI